MKKTGQFFVLIATGILFSLTGFSQSPDFFNYQAIVRDASGNPIISTSVDVDITIRHGAPDGADVYTESHAATTNDYGLLTLQIGNGTTGQYLADIDWSAGPYYIKVDIDNTELSNTQLISVPYAKYASNAGNGVTGTQTTNWNSAYSWGNHASAGYSPLTNDWTRYDDTLYYINGNVGVGTKDPRSTLSVYGSTVNDTAIFEVKNNLGQTVFAVYNEGVHITIDEDYSKGTKGGFSIGGFDRTKGIQEYLRVTADSTRVYVNQDAKGTKGGFAIGGFDRIPGKNALYNFLNLTPENYLIGHSAGENITSGTKNFFAGYEAGMMNEEGSNNIMVGYAAGKTSQGSLNVFIGTESGTNNDTGWGNVFIGELAGYNNDGGSGTAGARNVFLGFRAGYENLTGGDNVYIGTVAGSNNDAGIYNTMIGCEAGDFAESGSYDVYLGHRAGYDNDGSSNVVIGELAGSNKNNYGNPNTTYDNSVFIGASSGYSNTTGDYNVFVGRWSGGNNTTGLNNTYIGSSAGGNTNGSRNVFVGYNAGYSESGNDKLYIANSNTTTPLIWGDFASGQLKFNGDILSPLNIGTGTGAQEIVIDGNSGLLQTTHRVEGAYKGSIGWDVANERFFIYTGGNALFAKDGHVGINNQAPSASYALWVNGDLRVNSSVYTSDARYKENVVSISNSLSKVMSIDGVYYTWNKNQYPDMSFDDNRQIGFIAQDIQKVLPEVVSFDDKGFAGVDYPKITAVLVEAIKEQQKIIDEMSGALKDSNSELEAMKKRLRSAEDKINLILSTLK